MIRFENQEITNINNVLRVMAWSEELLEMVLIWPNDDDSLTPFGNGYWVDEFYWDDNSYWID